MKKYEIWDLYQKMPDGWVLDEKTGSPLSGYTFITNGRSVLNGGRRALLLTRPLQRTLFLQSDAQTNKVEYEVKIKKKESFKIDKPTLRSLNRLAREQMKQKLLKDILFDLMVCELEGWDKIEFINELKAEINNLGALNEKK